MTAPQPGSATPPAKGVDLGQAEVESLFAQRLAEAFAALGCFNLAVFGKTGVGKSTLSSNIAGCFARQGHTVMLGDVDRQQSSRLWLRLRPDNMPSIQTWDISEDHIARPPKGVTHVVLDTPAGLHGKGLDAVMKLAGTPCVKVGVYSTSVMPESTIICL